MIREGNEVAGFPPITPGGPSWSHLPRLPNTAYCCHHPGSHAVTGAPLKKEFAVALPPPTWLLGFPQQRQRTQELLFRAAMPHFLDWFVPVYLMISILILVGFGACIYYFEPGLQEAHKWRTQRPIMERDLRKTLMIRDNLAFGVPEV
ncbi:small integral membrane protein 45 [Patagioenas fasciata]|uniref:small integral membrane protein 45 n=1 Tax=Patagioenas fasciata TaxID=372321 RepID=UPI003A9A3507